MTGSENIKTIEQRIERMGMNGTNGVLNFGLGISFCFLMKMIPAATTINANRVPMLPISATTCNGTNPATRATKIPVTNVPIYGV